jgi:hypothetical protein
MSGMAQPVKNRLLENPPYSPFIKGGMTMYKIHIMPEKLIKPKFQNVIPKEVREKLHLSPRQTVD